MHEALRNPNPVFVSLRPQAPNSPLLLAALLPLLRALCTASRPGAQPQLAERLKTALTRFSNRKCVCRGGWPCAPTWLTS